MALYHLPSALYRFVFPKKDERGRVDQAARVGLRFGTATFVAGSAVSVGIDV